MMPTTRFPGIDTALAAQIDRVFATVGQGFNPYLEVRRRRRELVFLNSLTDAELDRLGLRRDLIAMHVFRYLLGL